MLGKWCRLVFGCVTACVLALIALWMWCDSGDVSSPIVTEGRTAPLPGPRLPAEQRTPVIALIGHNANTELVDFVVPYSVLKRSGVAEVWALGLEPGPIRFFPALSARPDADVAAFDQRHPAGADYVIVPAVHEDADPRLLSWVRSQARKGAAIIGICDGVWVLARAGLLDGREAVSHWYSRTALASDFPAVRWRQDRRYVTDGKVVTTTGVSASIPLSLALVETLAGRPKARELARALGEDAWDDAHAAAAFRLRPKHVSTAVKNTAAFWRHETLVARLVPGGDDLSLALSADAFARSYRTSVVGASVDAQPVALASGLVYLSDGRGWAAGSPMPRLPGRENGLDAALARPALAEVLELLQARYGQATADFVALQLEYPRPQP
ncbi:DJ-1/PfpI family protein [Achromobacter sp. Marseille-Q0513]|uniref:DJ-1/PfpI family protein n=1 Tax=Achromobacter sp. Marseille-Q0513 TaxID=2829161 RepID=UPI001BA063D1|nr:DJ-1/PfpI family protein [Achromobacter sp. Marseille-Q0513]MBR8653607.1 DJ-1/PfpI family protein [Achromobacter sp. Marseille-Q0513]